MSISSSLNAGVAGLNANATRLATISDNIANSSTYGYKRAEADFHSVVIQEGNRTGYSAGGVRVSSTRLIDQRGPLIGTKNATDLAIDGRGFMPITNMAAVDADAGSFPVSLITTGSFRPDANGVLRTESGHVLLGWPADADGTLPSFPRDTLNALEPVRINANQYVGNPSTLMRLGVNMPATGSVAGSSGDPYELSVEYFGNLGTSEQLSFTFTPVVPTTGASNTWTMQIADSASGGAVIGEYTIVFDASQSAGGTVQSVTAINGGAYDPLTGEIPLIVGGGNLALDVGRPGEPNGMTQLSTGFAPVSISKNGSAVAILQSVEVDEQGYLHVIYDQGFSRRIYQIPVVDVPNPNGLITQNDQSYLLSPKSGAFYLWDAGDGPTGSMAGYSREESSTDVAAELTQLIQTQRAYSSNAKIIQTVDEMLQETTNIKR